MNNQRKQLYLIGAWAIGLTVVLSTLCVQAVQFKQVRRDIAGLTCADVRDLLVFDGAYPDGSPRKVSDPDTITMVLSSLQVGSQYRPSHDQHNGFERCIVLEPHDLTLNVYQREGEENSVIVGVGSGYLRCPDADAWKKL